MSAWAVPTESELKAKPVLVGCCNGCGVVEPNYRPGMACDMDDDSRDNSYYHHRYHKRRMYCCEICSQYFYEKDSLWNHEHYWG